MNPRKLHKFRIEGLEDEILTGVNCQIFMDGKSIQGCTRLTFEIEGSGPAKLTMEMVGEIEIQGVLNPVFFSDQAKDETP